jgi:AbrB family looped-hinge helix DNA binding protein
MGDRVQQWIRTMDRYGRVTIPAELRRQLKLTPGTRIAIEVKDGVILIRRAPTQR